MTAWRYIGEITLLQAQFYEMTGKGSYDLDALTSVERLRLTPDGPLGLIGDTWIVDRHHRYHPDARHWHAQDVLSFGFTSHYEHMGDMFRPLPVGHAGENVIVDTRDLLSLEDIAGGIMVETPRGAVEFATPTVMEPCVEFTRFITNRPDASATDVNPSRQKLRKGVRGYSVGITNPEPVDLTTGLRVSVRRAQPG